MSDVFNEVDEDYRRERALQFWRRYGTLVIVLFGLVLIATAAIGWWRRHQEEQRAAATQSLSEIVDRTQTTGAGPTADALAQYAKTADTDHAFLARLYEANDRRTAGDKPGALQVYRTLAGDGSLAKTDRDLATVLAANLDADDGDPATLIGTLEPIAVDGNPWRFIARELIALLSVRRGDDARAEQLLTGIGADPAAPPALAQRARELASFYRGN